MATAVSALASALLLALLMTSSAAATPRAGVQAHLLWGDVSSSEVSEQLDAVAASGARYVRVDLGWSSLEPDRKGDMSDWYLSKIDSVVSKADARGVKVLFTVWQTPCWASSAPDSLKQNCSGSWWDRGVQMYPPRRDSDYADALAFLVNRYGDDVSAWELWNEPNHRDYFKSPDPADDYADLVKEAYPAAKRADDDSKILAGSLSNSDYEFTEDLFQEGIKNDFDAFSIHPYSEDRGPLDPGGDQYAEYSFVRGVPAVRRVLADHDDREPLWLSEFGWSTCDVRGQEAWRNCVSESRQAEWLEDAYRKMRDWDYVKAGVWFKLQNTRSSSSDQVANYGLLDADGSQKPAFDAFQESASMLTAARRKR